MRSFYKLYLLIVFSPFLTSSCFGMELANGVLTLVCKGGPTIIKGGKAILTIGKTALTIGGPTIIKGGKAILTIGQTTLHVTKTVGTAVQTGAGIVKAVGLGTQAVNLATAAAGSLGQTLGLPGIGFPETGLGAKVLAVASGLSTVGGVSIVNTSSSSTTSTSSTSVTSLSIPTTSTSSVPITPLSQGLSLGSGPLPDGAISLNNSLPSSSGTSTSSLPVMSTPNTPITPSVPTTSTSSMPTTQSAPVQSGGSSGGGASLSVSPQPTGVTTHSVSVEPSIKPIIMNNGTVLEQGLSLKSGPLPDGAISFNKALPSGGGPSTSSVKGGGSSKQIKKPPFSTQAIDYSAGKSLTKAIERMQRRCGQQIVLPKQPVNFAKTLTTTTTPGVVPINTVPDKPIVPKDKKCTPTLLPKEPLKPTILQLKLFKDVDKSTLLDMKVFKPKPFPKCSFASSTLGGGVDEMVTSDVMVNKAGDSIYEAKKTGILESFSSIFGKVRKFFFTSDKTNSLSDTITTATPIGARPGLNSKNDPYNYMGTPANYRSGTTDRIRMVKSGGKMYFFNQYGQDKTEEVLDGWKDKTNILQQNQIKQWADQQNSVIQVPVQPNVFGRVPFRPSKFSEFIGKDNRSVGFALSGKRGGRQGSQINKKQKVSYNNYPSKNANLNKPILMDGRKNKNNKPQKRIMLHGTQEVVPQPIVSNNVQPVPVQQVAIEQVSKNVAPVQTTTTTTNANTSTNAPVQTVPVKTETCEGEDSESLVGRGHLGGLPFKSLVPKVVLFASEVVADAAVSGLAGPIVSKILGKPHLKTISYPYTVVKKLYS